MPEYIELLIQHNPSVFACVEIFHQLLKHIYFNLLAFDLALLFPEDLVHLFHKIIRLYPYEVNCDDSYQCVSNNHRPVSQLVNPNNDGY